MKDLFRLSGPVTGLRDGVALGNVRLGAIPLNKSGRNRVGRQRDHCER